MSRHLISATLLPVLGLLFLASSGCRKDETFDIGMVTFAGYGPLYVAKEKNFFDGLDVQLHRIEDVSAIRAGVVKGDLEAYLATPDIAQDIDSEPVGTGVWALDESAGGDAVLARPGIASITDLKGKKVAAEPGLPPYFVLLGILDKNGMSLADIEFQDMTTQDAAAALVAGTIDAAGLYDPALHTAKEECNCVIVASSEDTPGLIVDLLFVENKVLTSHRSDVEKIIDGWNKALAFIESNPDEAYAIMAKAYGLSVEDFRSSTGGLKWIDSAHNKELFGTDAQPGVLYSNYDLVNRLLRQNRPSTYESKANDKLTRDFLN